MNLAEKVNETAFRPYFDQLIQHHTIDILARRIAEENVNDLLGEDPAVMDYAVEFAPVLDPENVVLATPLGGIPKSDLVNDLAREHGITIQQANSAVKEAKDKRLIQISIGKGHRAWVTRMTHAGEWDIQWSALFEGDEIRGKFLVEKVQTLTGKGKSSSYSLISRAVSDGKLIEFLDGREKSYQLATGPVSETN